MRKATSDTMTAGRPRSAASRAETGYRCAPMTLRKLLLACVLLGCLCAPGAAHADSDQASIIMDDDQLLYRGDNTSARALTTARSLGAEVVRATVLWRVVAENANLSNAEIKKIKGEKLRKRAIAQRARFKPGDPRTYPTRNWDRYDNLVKTATQLGMRVLFTVTGPGPRFAHKKPPPSQRINAVTYKPSPSGFRSFVEAVGRRYSGRVRDENGVRRALPRVSLWSIWNEPNQPGWLTPQWEKVGGQNVPASPRLYRELYQAGRQGLGVSGHGGDTILIGETAPLGSPLRGPRNGLRPVPFLRELVCVAPNGTQYTGVDATRRGCDDFARTGPLQASGYAHHPYTKKAAPTKAPSNPDELTIANISLLGKLLDTLSAQSGGKIAAGLPLLLTEFGYESNPPDPRNGIPLLRQAEFNTLAEFLAFNDPRVKATTQFLISDAQLLKKYPRGSRLYYFTYQSGLYNLRGQAKPAAFAYAFPLLTFPAGAGITGFWGQLRFRPNGAKDVAIIFWRPAPPTGKVTSSCANPAAGWVQQGPPVETTFRGYFTGAIPTPGPAGEYCAVYLDPAKDKITHQSLAVKP